MPGPAVWSGSSDAGNNSDSGDADNVNAGNNSGSADNVNVGSNCSIKRNHMQTPKQSGGSVKKGIAKRVEI